jgi:beta-alanine degradation protein BauB
MAQQMLRGKTSFGLVFREALASYPAEMIDLVMNHITLSRCAFLAAIAFTPLATLTSQPVNQSQKIPQFENDEVNVWKSIVMPNAPLTMHTHEHPRVIVALSGGTMKIVYENGPTETHRWETGKAYWLSSEEGKKRHADVNSGNTPIEVMVVELKDAK